MIANLLTLQEFDVFSIYLRLEFDCGAACSKHGVNGHAYQVCFFEVGPTIVGIVNVVLVEIRLVKY